MASVLIAVGWRSTVARRRDERLERGAASRTATISNALGHYENALQAQRSLWVASTSVNRLDFARFAHTLDLGRRYPGLQGIGWRELVPGGEADDFVRQARADGIPGFSIHPPGRRPVYYVMRYSYPVNLFGAQLGADARAIPTILAAMEQARDTGQTTISSQTTLTADQSLPRERRPIAFELFAPVYQGGSPPASPSPASSCTTRRSGGGACGQLPRRLARRRAVRPDRVVHPRRAPVRAPLRPPAGQRHPDRADHPGRARARHRGRGQPPAGDGAVAAGQGRRAGPAGRAAGPHRRPDRDGQPAGLGRRAAPGAGQGGPLRPAALRRPGRPRPLQGLQRPPRPSGRLRKTDLLARYGGEEFAVLLPDCELEDAMEIADRLRTAQPEGTCSIGVAAWDGREEAIGLVVRADRALYAAKEAGRNRCLADQPAADARRRRRPGGSP